MLAQVIQDLLGRLVVILDQLVQAMLAVWAMRGLRAHWAILVHVVRMALLDTLDQLGILVQLVLDTLGHAEQMVLLAIMDPLVIPDLLVLQWAILVQVVQQRLLLQRLVINKIPVLVHLVYLWVPPHNDLLLLILVILELTLTLTF
jgi:hypothetical protein